MNLHRKLISTLLLLAALVLVACESKEGGDEEKGGEEEKAETLPEETESLALDEGESAIPATIEVPKGSTTFNDDPTRIRISYPGGEGRDSGSLFGVQIAEGNEFNTNLAETRTELETSDIGGKKTIIKASDELLMWKSETDDGYTSVSFYRLIDLDGKTWVCKQGNYGGWTEEQAKRQVAACETLAAK